MNIYNNLENISLVKFGFNLDLILIVQYHKIFKQNILKCFYLANISRILYFVCDEDEHSYITYTCIYIDF